jgi:demethylmenaquinone methyltransferase/2-methoxy-6-polyprenyl-1,4-benzoquinol methylase/phosphoethanolamine N-methyltransferase
MGQIATRLALLGGAAIGVLVLSRARAKRHEATDGAPPTAGRVLHQARWYDLFGRIVSLGRDAAIRETLVDLAEPMPGEHVLDVGCGTGTLALALESRAGAGAVRGIDASPEMIAVARAKAGKADAAVDFQVALIEALPFPAETFDLVTSSLMLHHLPDDLKRAGFGEIRRVLKPGGRFVAVDFAAHSHSPLGHLLAILGHGLGEDMVAKLTPMLAEVGFTDIAAIPTRHTNVAFIAPADLLILSEPTNAENRDFSGDRRCVPVWRGC